MGSCIFFFPQWPRRAWCRVVSQNFCLPAVRDAKKSVGLSLCDTGRPAKPGVEAGFQADGRLCAVRQLDACSRVAYLWSHRVASKLGGASKLRRGRAPAQEAAGAMEADFAAGGFLNHGQNRGTDTAMRSVQQRQAQAAGL